METVDGDDPPATSVSDNTAEAARKALARELALVEVAVQERFRRVGRHAQRAVLAPVAAAGVAEHVGLGIVEEHAVAERARVVRPGRQLDRHLHLAAIEEQHAAGLHAGQVHAALGAVDVVEVQLVEHEGTVVRVRIERAPLEAKLLRDDVHCPAELPAVEVEAEDRVEPSRGEIESTLPDRDLVTMLEVGIAPGADRPEIGRIGEELVARRDVDGLGVESDPA